MIAGIAFAVLFTAALLVVPTLPGIDKPARIVLKKRGAKNAFQEIWTTKVDPADKFIMKAGPPPGKREPALRPLNLSGQLFRFLTGGRMMNPVRPDNRVSGDRPHRPRADHNPPPGRRCPAAI